MLMYRAASFFANLNCPELTSGFYTREEMLDNDFGQKESAGKNLNDMLREDEDDSIDAESMIIE